MMWLGLCTNLSSAPVSGISTIALTIAVSIAASSTERSHADSPPAPPLPMSPQCWSSLLLSAGGRKVQGGKSAHGLAGDRMGPGNGHVEGSGRRALMARGRPIVRGLCDCVIVGERVTCLAARTCGCEGLAIPVFDQPKASSN
eukprot:363877-Chlamydomonas_euryale.AAC.1